MKTKSFAAHLQPNPGTDVSILSQIDSVIVSPAIYLSVGRYQLHLNPFSGLTSANQVIPTGNALSAGNSIALQPGFQGSTGTGGLGHGLIEVLITDSAGSPVDDSFLLNGQLIGL